MKFIKYICFITLLFLLSVSAFAQNPKIRVGLNFSSSAVSGDVSIYSPYGFQAGFLDENKEFMPIMFFGDTDAKISVSGDGLVILGTDGSVMFEPSTNGALSLCPLTSGNDDEGYIPYIQIGSYKYSGILSFSNTGGKITVINVVDAEMYFKGVLPSEVYPSWHPEALKAAAVATRTYTYHSMSGKHSKYGVDLCATTCCQVYSGITRCQDSTNKAVDETQNIVLTYNGKLITAVYHAISGGVTETAAGAWGGNPENFPYLTVVETPFEEYDGLGNGKWRHILYESDFAELIADSSYAGKINPQIQSITIDDETPGYLNNVTVKDTAGNSILLKTSSNVRSFFNTLSANFTIAPVLMPSSESGQAATVLTADGEKNIQSGDAVSYVTADGTYTAEGLKSAYFIDGKGFGHGVGLSQYGAQFAAKEGYTYDQILLTYYPGVIFEDYTEYIQK